MKSQEWLDLVHPEWRLEFETFVETGEASEEFLAYLDRDPACQKAVEAAFTQQAAAFEELSRTLRASVPKKALAETQAFLVSQRMANAVEETLQLPPAERTQVLTRTVSTLTQGGPDQRREALRAFVADLEKQVAAV